MTATAMGLTDVRERIRRRVRAATGPALLDGAAKILLLGFVASLQVSIAAADILLAAMMLCWIAQRVRIGGLPPAPRFFIPLAAYAGVTLVSTAFSLDPLESLVDSKQLLLFLIVPAVYDIARGERATTVADVIVTAGAASAAFGVIQYGILHWDDLGQRPQGALSHYMTYSGMLMLVICAAASRLVFGARDRIWPALVMPVLVVALSLTLTRGAWVGAAIAVSVLLALRDIRLTALVPIVVAIVFVIAPGAVTERMKSTFDLNDLTVRDRMAMMQIGTAMIRDYPLTGVGPNMVPRLYSKYRPPDAVEKVNPHLHNVPLQIAAERGLPALAVWGWLVAALGVMLLRLFHRARDRVLAAAALAAVVGMLGAGLTEYNFGDSEFLMLFLVICTLPFAATRGD